MGRKACTCGVWMNEGGAGRGEGGCVPEKARRGGGGVVVVVVGWRTASSNRNGTAKRRSRRTQKNTVGVQGWGGVCVYVEICCGKVYCFFVFFLGGGRHYCHIFIVGVFAILLLCCGLATGTAPGTKGNVPGGRRRRRRKADATSFSSTPFLLKQTHTPPTSLIYIKKTHTRFRCLDSSSVPSVPSGWVGGRGKEHWLHRHTCAHDSDDSYA